MAERNIALRRVLAFMIDYCLMCIYAFGLYLIGSNINISINTPWEGQALGFITLTLPVLMYFYLFESSSFRASPGKLICKIKIDSIGSFNNRSVLIRNLLKFLPWEIAHIGVHQIYFLSQTGNTVPSWVWLFLILPQLLIIAYIISLIISKGKQTVYDRIAGTSVVS